MTEILGNESFQALLLINVIAALGMNLVYVTGQLNIGMAGFMAIGAYVTAVTDRTLGWPLPVELAAAAAAAAVIAVPIAIGATRVRGIYLVMATLAVGEVVRIAIGNIDALGGLQGYSGVAPLELSSVAATALIVLAAATAIMASGLGLQMRSLFDDEDAAAAAGVRTRRVKVGAVVLSAAVTAVAGGLLARHLLFIAPANFGVELSFEIALFTLIGGVHSVLGAVAGAALITAFLETLRQADRVIPGLDAVAEWHLPIYGAIIIALIALRPEGLVSRQMSLLLSAPFRRLRRRLAMRRAAAGGAVSRAYDATRPGPEPVLEIRGVGHRFDGVQALSDVTLSVRRAEILALIGANGAGKSTLIDVVSGRHRLQEGAIVLEGADVSSLSPEARVRRGVARTFQSVRVFDHLTVDETIRLGLQAAGPRPARGVHELLELIGLQDRLDALPAQLPLGDRRKLEIARAFAGAPRVILLDEPSVGLNDAERDELATLIEAIRRSGAAVVLVDHNIDLALGIADRVAALDFGDLIVRDGDPAAVFDEPRLREAYFGPQQVPA